MTGPDLPEGRPIRIEPDAPSGAGGRPAFIYRPKGAPVYHGFPILEDVSVDGFRLGMITDWEAEDTDIGDAFVVAPDDSRAGIIWEVCNEAYVKERKPPTSDRWGVWNVGFAEPMTTRDAARRNLAAILTTLRPAWELWRRNR